MLRTGGCGDCKADGVKVTRLGGVHGGTVCSESCITNVDGWVYRCCGVVHGSCLMGVRWLMNGDVCSCGGAVVSMEETVVVVTSSQGSRADAVDIAVQSTVISCEGPGVLVLLCRCKKGNSLLSTLVDERAVRVAELINGSAEREMVHAER